MKISAIITVRKKSSRIKNKALIKINNESITKIKLDQVRRQKLFQNIYFSCNISKLNLYAKKKGFNLLNRPKKLFLDSTVSQIAPYLANKVLDDHICYLMVTSPLITDKTLTKCLEIYKKLDFKKYDSLSTFVPVKEFLWSETKPLNYSISNQPHSQNLKGYFKLCPAICILPKKNIYKFKNVIGKKPFKYLINMPEAMDIDWKHDYELAKIFAKKTVK
jgi:CMP-N-acetylneuraminic acid synthetase